VLFLDTGSSSSSVESAIDVTVVYIGLPGNNKIKFF